MEMNCKGLDCFGLFIFLPLSLSFLRDPTPLLEQKAGGRSYGQG
jgi:hypothetical protein